MTSTGTTTLTRLPPKQMAFWHSLGGTSINAAKKSRRKRTQHSYDPFGQYQIDAVEMVQRRAARFVTGQYNRYQSVTSMLQELKWTSLQQRRQEQRLVNLYKCVNNINALQIPSYVVRPTRTTRGQNNNSFIPISCNNDSYKYSYFPMTLLEWNNLP